MSLYDRAEPTDTERPPVSIDFEAAESAVARLTRQYPAMARVGLKEMRDRMARRDNIDPDEEMQELRRFAHNFTGQGASFNYPLVSDIADLLRGHLHACESHAMLRRETVIAHLDAIGEVLDKELSGDGGEAGRAILARLKDIAT